MQTIYRAIVSHYTAHNTIHTITISFLIPKIKEEWLLSLLSPLFTFVLAFFILSVHTLENKILLLFYIYNGL